MAKKKQTTDPKDASAKVVMSQELEDAVYAQGAPGETFDQIFRRLAEDWLKKNDTH
jgi:hypothetical protein